MKLSIIVPVYNMAVDGKLDFCLQSLLKQSIDNYEVIAVDDKSTDHSLKILERWKAEYKDKLVILQSPENRKQGGAKNLGLSVAKGEFVGFVDSDDWIAPTMYEKLLNKAEETKADCVGCDYSLVDTHTMKVGTYIKVNQENQVGKVSSQRQKELILNPGSMVVKIYKRTLFIQNSILFPEHMFYEDNAIAGNLLLHVKNFQRVEEPLYYYYQHNLSTVHTISEARCNDRMKAAQMALEGYKKQEFYEKYPVEIEYKFFELYYKNTLFSYMQNSEQVKISYINQIRKGFLEHKIKISKNRYYQELTDKENKRLIWIHLKSNILFYLIYKLLYIYRDIRYGKN